ncbi:sigma-70 family RNA polymerase sigma factor [Flavitalea sp. BT771]|uniref:RNA polymerase sigma factor n=1 Tax=Flavitalea sp. BT771 TaxID=3063329 RepID=UPI0026E25C5F|nr:sigma-70 family RNA polymerase sigma factor [Flavitalea sp. BT771]MDO6435141.1 sigma-70 family RNA polymerase sigma factor [Flavitalea sp. BT771]MDV6224154.1 sigma-70 family RNA polymerase sigma factor [Flavitalea sp. BT771]
MNASDSSHQSVDLLLLQQIAQGSKEAFNALYAKHWERAYSDAYKRLKENDLAKDIVQDIFTHIWLNRTTLHIENFPAYLHTAIRNKVIKSAARQNLTHPFFDALESLAEKKLQADADVLWKEFFRSYEALLQSLPTKRQAIFRLHFHEDLPTKDIAAKLGLSRKTVQNQLGKAIEKLRVSLSHLLSAVLVLLSMIIK